MDIALEPLIDITQQAGDAILAVYKTDFDVEIKGDDSPVTQADLAAHAVIERGLNALTPDIPVLSEESVPPEYSVRQNWSRYWLVDPLDGTKEFINKNDEFTVNIALMQDGEPVLGLVGVPAQQRIYVGDVAAGIAFCEEDGVRTDMTGRPMQRGRGVTAVASRNHGGERLEAYLNKLGEVFGDLERTPVGSSLKLCILARGGADIYPRLGLTSEWDIAAAHALLKAAGGDVWAADGSPIAYNKPDTFLNPEFIAVSDSNFDWRGCLPDVNAL